MGKSGRSRLSLFIPTIPSPKNIKTKPGAAERDEKRKVHTAASKSAFVS